MASRYLKIWKQIRLTGTCTLAVPIPLHARIVRAVRDEKYEDRLYRGLVAESKKRSILTHKSESCRLRFFLTDYRILEQTEMEDL